MIFIRKKETMYLLQVVEKTHKIVIYRGIKGSFCVQCVGCCFIYIYINRDIYFSNL